MEASSWGSRKITTFKKLPMIDPRIIAIAMRIEVGSIRVPCILELMCR